MTVGFIVNLMLIMVIVTSQLFIYLLDGTLTKVFLTLLQAPPQQQIINKL